MLHPYSAITNSISLTYCPRHSAFNVHDTHIHDPMALRVSHLQQLLQHQLQLSASALTLLVLQRTSIRSHFDCYDLYDSNCSISPASSFGPNTDCFYCSNQSFVTSSPTMATFTFSDNVTNLHYDLHHSICNSYSSKPTTTTAIVHDTQILL